ncbi:hypothetical protein KIH87_13335 [Paraneptunicella aestuarii]|uniref:2-keto-4-pentenoate hydratase n=1 Tax=Paraneptunicella aestuarii TaxID=2831148 RepID=UPI001E35BC18|nr:hypothetical protein [Paraneptunicella aestuarii]UAA37686.1 hypothetical protein KIH87_13335 [Paraneptunicella aestuarii]
MARLSFIFVSLSILLLSSSAFANCLKDNEIEHLVSHFPDKPVGNLDEIESLDDAYCIQGKYVQMLSQHLGKEEGKIVGYKIGFTGKAGQEKFGISGPAFGVLMEGMFLQNHSEISANFGFRPMIEPDLMVTVKDESIMSATSLMDVAKSLDMIFAFIEMPTIQFPFNKPFDSHQLVALNVAATKMVLGDGIKVEPTQAFLDKLAQATTEFTDSTGKMIQAAPVKNLMDHPFNAVLWLVNELKRHGKSLQKGDRISLGAVGKLFPLANETRTYNYSINGLSETPLQAAITVKAV